MKHLLLSTALAVAVVAGCSQPNSPSGSANNPGSQQAQAQTQTQAAAPRVECTRQRVVHKKEWGTGGVAGTILGGAAGGLVGNQFGKGQGNTAMTAAGAASGAVAGHEIGKSQDTQVTYEEHCRDVSAN